MRMNYLKVSKDDSTLTSLTFVVGLTYNSRFYSHEYLHKQAIVTNLQAYKLASVNSLVKYEIEINKNNLILPKFNIFVIAENGKILFLAIVLRIKIYF